MVRWFVMFPMCDSWRNAKTKGESKIIICSNKRKKQKHMNWNRYIDTITTTSWVKRMCKSGKKTIGTKSQWHNEIGNWKYE